jgi:hypothetical protein
MYPGKSVLTRLQRCGVIPRETTVDAPERIRFPTGTLRIVTPFVTMARSSLQFLLRLEVQSPSVHARPLNPRRLITPHAAVDGVPEPHFPADFCLIRTGWLGLGEEAGS